MGLVGTVSLFTAVIVGFWVLAVLAVPNERNVRRKNRDPRLGDCDSWIEKRMYNAFMRLGYKPVCQQKVGPYYIDLAVTVNRMRIAVECDGFAYHSSPEQRARDKRRTRYLQQRGWSVLRFSGSSINRNATRCVYSVLQYAGVEDRPVALKPQTNKV